MYCQKLSQNILANIAILMCRDLVVTNKQLSIPGMREEVSTAIRSLDTFRSDVAKYLAQQQQIKALPATTDCGIVCIRLQVRVPLICDVSHCNGCCSTTTSDTPSSKVTDTPPSCCLNQLL